MFAAIQHAFEPEIDEEDVGDGIDDFGDVRGCVVVLCFVQITVH